MNRVTWKRTDSGSGWKGRAGKLQLFAISWRLRSEDPQYVLSSALLGFEGQRWKDDDPEKLQARAERVLTAWLEEIGAVEKMAEPVRREPSGRFVHVEVTVEPRSRGGSQSTVIEIGTEELAGLSPEEREKVIFGYAEETAVEMAPWGFAELEGEFEEGEGLES